MSTKRQTNVYITNDTDGHADIELSHQFGDKTPETQCWLNVAPKGKAGPLIVNYETGINTAFGWDWWWVSLKVKDGKTPGFYISQDWKTRCILKKEDSKQDLEFTVDTTNFNVKVPSGGTSVKMSRIGDYTTLDHIFVLMLENRSFDQIFGFFANKEINGLTGKEFNKYGGQTYQVQRGPQDPMTTDPGHEFANTMEQLCGAGTKNPYKSGDKKYPPVNTSGFVSNYATTEGENTPLPTFAHFGDVMKCCDHAQVKALHKLAAEFAVCDRWYSSIPGPTWPNRLFAMAASSGGLDDSPSKSHMIKWNTKGFKHPNGNIFELLWNKNNHEYRIYQDSGNKYADKPVKNNRGNFGDHAMASILFGVSGIRNFEHFAADLKDPYPFRYTWIEPHYGKATTTFEGGSSQHPMDSLAAGDRLVAAVYNAIRNSPLWDRSLLIITYDEHGGFYDHDRPPGTVAPNDGSEESSLNANGFDFKQLGVRVPAVVVSPLIPQRTVDSTVYDHTSILATVERVLGMQPLTERDKNAKDLLHLLKGPLRDDCPFVITGGFSPIKTTPMGGSAAKKAPGAKKVSGAKMPLPEKGNLTGFLQVAAKTEAELNGGKADARKAAQAKLKSIKTMGDAENYLQEIATKMQAESPRQNKMLCAADEKEPCASEE
jgi:phospholipase C